MKKMKIKFNHKKNAIMDSLGVSKSRMDTIMGAAQEDMKKNSPNGKKSEFLEAALANCDTAEEQIAASIVWYASVSQMETIAKLKAAGQQKSRIIKPEGSRIIRPGQ
jgi:hypothetical protein